MTVGRQRTGRRGEDLATQWYVEHGFDVVARNWRDATGELDLIVRRGGLVVFVEVKARSGDRFGHPAEAVGRDKQRRLRRLAARWLGTTGTRWADLRFDVVAVTPGRVEVIAGAF